MGVISESRGQKLARSRERIRPLPKRFDVVCSHCGETFHHPIEEHFQSSECGEFEIVERLIEQERMVMLRDDCTAG